MPKRDCDQKIENEGDLCRKGYRVQNSQRVNGKEAMIKKGYQFSVCES